MKAKGILIFSAAGLLSVGALMHLSGGRPKCPLGSLMHKESSSVKKAETTSAGQQKVSDATTVVVNEK